MGSDPVMREKWGLTPSFLRQRVGQRRHDSRTFLPASVLLVVSRRHRPRGCGALRLFERQTRDDAANLLAVEHFADEQLGRDLLEAGFVLGENLARALVVVGDKTF